MFVKIENFWLNTEHIVTFEPQGKAFRINLSNGAFLVLQLKDYLVLIKAMKIKEPLKSVKKKSVSHRLPTANEFKAQFPKEHESIIAKTKPSPATTDKSGLKRAAVKEAEAKTLKKETGEGAAGEKTKKKVVIKPEAKK